MILKTALAGLGLAYLPENLVQDHVAAGRLVRVLADWSQVMSGYHLFIRTGNQARPSSYWSRCCAIAHSS